jgi:hypothetical protein
LRISAGELRLRVGLTVKTGIPVGILGSFWFSSIVIIVHV